MSTVSTLTRPNDPAGAPLDQGEMFWPQLKGRAGNEYSQFGEDGLIEAVFDVIGRANRWCFEVGAADGEFYSNTKRLREGGWSAVLIESNEGHIEKLREHASPSVRTIHAEVSGTMPIDDILAECKAPRDLDLGVIDIDGQDYWVWSDMRLYEPRVMLVEYGAEPSLAGCLPKRNDGNGIVIMYRPKRGGPGQSSLKGIRELGEAKGYKLVATTACNALFVKPELLP